MEWPRRLAAEMPRHSDGHFPLVNGMDFFIAASLTSTHISLSRMIASSCNLSLVGDPEESLIVIQTFY